MARIVTGISATPTGTAGAVAGIAGRRRGGNGATGMISRVTTGISTAPARTARIMAGIAAGVMSRIIAAAKAGSAVSVATSAAIGENGARERRRESQR
jgi:uncharacterized protein with LGFP repeats